MAKQVRYLRQVTPHLEDKYGAERANASGLSFGSFEQGSAGRTHS